MNKLKIESENLVKKKRKIFNQTKLDRDLF